MKKLLLTICLLTVVFTSFANHTKGGWIYYEYMGPGAVANTVRYRITLKIYTECNLNANQWCPNVNISIFNGSSYQLVDVLNVNYSDSENIKNCTSQECHPCINPIPNICYKIATFTFTKDLPIIPEGYIISYQRCCRIANIINLSPGSSSVGDTWTVTIPGTNGADPNAYQNSSALFSQNDTALICRDNYFTFDFSATDKDQDSLAYAFSDAYYSPQGNNGGQCGSQSENPPFSTVNYGFGYSGRQPMGAGVTINPRTGIVSGIAPSDEGTYVLTCTITEYKKGTNIVKGRVQKSLHINVADCALTQAVLDPEYFSCSSFTKSFSNNASGGNIQTYFWDFGVPGRDDDTSTVATPSFTYPDTGSYVLKLVVNRHLPCPDSGTSIVKVYPVFAPAFTVQGQCKNTPISFSDASTTTYGTVNSWSWDFGDPAAASDTSTRRNAVHTFATGADYDITFTASNDKGCRETIVKTILITDRPALSLTNDTLICVIDTLQIKAEGFGTVRWTPDYNINNLASFTPLVSPDRPTTYTVTLTDPYGCVGSDSVFIDVKESVTLRAGNDSTICRGDPVIVDLTSDGLYYVWTQNGGENSISDPQAKTPRLTPLTTTSYHVVGSIGKCIAEDNVVLKVVPYPLANAGPDTTICMGTSAQLHASGGSSYTWTPDIFLTNRSIANPVGIRPGFNIPYIVTVTDTLGCPKAVMDTMLLTVSKIDAEAGPADTSVVLGQPLILSATGSTGFSWSPTEGLNNSRIANPVASPQSDISYVVKVSNIAGCFDYDTINVKVFRLNAGLYVPTAFSPNGDGRNDYFRLIAIGMKSVQVFRVYNRWGQMIYNDTDIENGWDGTFKGNEQAPGTYVWFAEGTDYRNNVIKRRGYTVLIR